MHININCGLSETEVNELAVKPIGLSSLSLDVTTVTPVGKEPSASLKSLVSSLFIQYFFVMSVKNCSMIGLTLFAAIYDII